MQPFQVEAEDGTQLAARDWRPAGEARGTVLLVHGLGEHLGRYDGVARRLNAEGYRVLGADLRGHGHSGGQRGHVRRFRDYGSDLRVLAAMAGRPFHVLAQSTGALVALDAFHDRDDGPDRYVFSSPLVGLHMDAPAWKLAFAPLLSVLFPTLPIGNELALQDLSIDPEVVAAYRDDPLRVPVVTPRWFTEMRRAVHRLWDRDLPRRPMQLHVAGDERILNREALEHFHVAWPGAKERHVWERMRHDLMMESCVDDMLERVVAFLHAA